MIANWPVEYHPATTAEPISSGIGRFSSATMAIVGIKLTGLGLPAIRDATCMQVNALVHFSAVMMRLRCR
jgi:hypothetical protein